MALRVSNFGTWASDSAVGTLAWSNPGYAETSNNSRAQASYTNAGVGNGLTHYLKGTVPTLNIPSVATITGVKVSPERYSNQNSSNNYVYDEHLRLVVDGSVAGDNKAAASTKWPTSEASVDYGGDGDLWGLGSLTPAEANALGVVLAARLYVTRTTVYAYVDHIQITVYFTLALTETEEAELVEIVTKLVGKSALEGVEIADVVLKALEKAPLGEDVTLSDVVDAIYLAAGMMASAEEDVTLTDDAELLFGKVGADTASLSDIITIVTNIAKTFSVTLSDAMAVVAEAVRVENITLADAVTKLYATYYTEAVALADYASGYAFRKNKPLRRYSTRFLAEVTIEGATRRYGPEDMYLGN